MFAKLLTTSCLLFAISVVQSQNAWCDYEQECADETLDDYETIYCVGFEACEDANMTSEENIVVYGAYAAIDSIMNSGYNGYCYGPFGCYEATVNITNDFYNYGIASTYDTDVNVGDDYVGHGAYCGYGANIRGADETGDYSYVYGFMGGAFSNHSGFYRLYAYGFLSMYGADITSKGDDDTTYNYLVAYGYYAMYDAEYTCQDGDYCLIYCDGVGCDGLTVYIEGDASYYSNCDDDDDSCAVCPTFKDVDSMAEYRLTEEYQLKQQERQARKEWLTDYIGFENVVNEQETQLQQEVEEVEEDVQDDVSDESRRLLSKKLTKRNSKHVKNFGGKRVNKERRYKIDNKKFNRKDAGLKVLEKHDLHFKARKHEEAHFGVINDISIDFDENSSKTQLLINNLMSYGVGIVAGLIVIAGVKKLQPQLKN